MIPREDRTGGEPGHARLHLLIPLGRRVTEALGEPASLHVELVLPPVDRQPAALLFCVPGGAMNRRYFDLATPPGEAEASFAEAMAARGMAVAIVDPLGSGESSLPADPYLLTPDASAAALGDAARHLASGLRSGTLADAPPWPDLVSIGVGHSYGAGLTIVQQAADPLHDALVLMGFETIGLPQHLPAAFAALRPTDARRRIAELARSAEAAPFTMLPAPPGPRSAPLAAAMDRLLATVTVTALIPDILAPDAASIAAPVMLVFGDRDIHGSPHRAAGAYLASRDVTLLILPDTRHNHLIFPSRTMLFDRLAQWIATVSGGPPGVAGSRSAQFR